LLFTLFFRFYEHSINEKVPRHKFPALLGLLGTDIAENFALRIFDTFSADKKSIRLNEYLKYVDVYHYGDEIERCRVTFQLMDKTRDNEIDLAEFGEYINLLIAAIRKVHPQSTDNLFSQKDIKDLFNKIVNNNKTTFSYQDFEKVYMEKPDLLSWIDYFKNNDEEVLYLINHNLRGLLFTLQTFFERFSKIMNETHTNSGTAYSNFEKDLKLFDLNPAINEIDRFCKAIDKRRKVFLNSAGRFNIRTIFEKLTKSFNDTMNINNREHSPGAPKTSHFPLRSSLNKFDFNLTKMSTNNNFNNPLLKGGMIENINSNDAMIEEAVDHPVKEPDSRLLNNTVELNSGENDKTYLPMCM
jgi:Ca2+-binding EF-hand superfamily protein